MAYRGFTEAEQKEAADYFFSLGVGADEAGARLGLLEVVAENEGRPLIDLHREQVAKKSRAQNSDVVSTPKHADDCTNSLVCRHCVGENCMTYHMACHVVGSMGDGRLKIMVFGDRYWNRDKDVSKVRYVQSSRVVKRNNLRINKV